jgi:8-oxo-dGTP pyrophosphatase MutT (NUDIX family)
VTGDPRAAALIAALGHLEPADDREAVDLGSTIDALRRLDRPFDESAQPEHVTASAFVLSSRGIVLHRHKHLGIWVQPGGHVDPGEAPSSAAARETKEEAGIDARHLDPPLLIHVNTHEGPRGHLHHDCRWLLVAEATAFSPAEGESSEIGWFLPQAALDRCEPGLRAGLHKVIREAFRLGLEPVASWPR